MLSPSVTSKSLEQLMHTPLLPFPERDSLTFNASEKLLSLKTSDVINSLIHLYRGELGRQLNYRNRLDRSTHWAVLISSGLTVLVLAYQDVPGYVSLLIAFFVCIFCLIEARRYLYYTVVKERVRLLEVGFYSNHVMGPKYNKPVANQSNNQSINQSINQPIKYEKGMKLTSFLPPVSHMNGDNPSDSQTGDQSNNQSNDQLPDAWIPRIISSIQHPKPIMTLTYSLLIRLHRIYLPLLIGVYIGWLMKMAWAKRLVDRMIPALFFGALSVAMLIFVYLVFPATVMSKHWVWQKLYWRKPNHSVNQVHVDV